MKTAEEVAREILGATWVKDPFPREIDAVAAIIRADREELLNRLAEVYESRVDTCAGTIEYFKKEAL